MTYLLQNGKAGAAGRRRWLQAALVAALLAGAPTGCSKDKGCERMTTAAYDPQAWPYPTAQAAIEAFLASEIRADLPRGAEFEYERTLPATPSRLEIAEYREVDGPGELSVQHGGPGWAVSGFHTCLDG